jgi:hypothetical protein
MVVATITDDVAFSRIHPKKERSESEEDEFFGEE